MCSIRNCWSKGAMRLLLGVAGAGMLAGTSGCQLNKPAPAARLNDTPLVIDEAMQQRDWDPSTRHYANGDVVAGPTGRVIEPKPEWSEGYRGVAADEAIGIANLVMLPVTMVMNPPWTSVQYQGVAVPPTYYAVPPTTPIN